MSARVIGSTERWDHARRGPPVAWRVRSGRRAFTLLEMLIVLTIFGVLMAALLVSFLISRSSFFSADSYIQVQQEARRALDTMVRELREAGWNTTTLNTCSPQTVGICATTLQLEFQIALGYNLNATYPACPVDAVCWGALDQNGTLQPGWTMRYRENAVTQQLVRQILNGGVLQPGIQVMANSLDTANTSFFYNATNKVITVNLAVKQTNTQLAGGSMSTTPTPLVSRVKLRN